jgi:hypothetical protein
VANVIVHEGILQIDHHQCRFPWIKVSMRMLDPATGEHTFGH